MLGIVVWVGLFFQAVFSVIPQVLQVDSLFINVFSDDETVYVTWNQVDDVVAYQLNWSLASETTWHEINLSSDQLHFVVTNLKNRQIYRFQVIALQNSTQIVESQIVFQTPNPRNNDTVIHTSWVRLNNYLTTQLSPPLDLANLKCRGKLVVWDVQAPDCIYETNGYFLFLARGAGSVFSAPQDSRPVGAIRKLAIQGIWHDKNPFDNPTEFPITITDILPPTIGLVTNFSTVRGYEIRYHPLLASRVTWFTPKAPVPGRYAIYHEGHCNNCLSAMDEPTGAETINWLLARGWQVVGMDMPLYGQNSVDRQSGDQLKNHQRYFDDASRESVGGSEFDLQLQNEIYGFDHTSNITQTNEQPILRDHNDFIFLDNGVRSPLQFFFLPVKAVVDMLVTDYTSNDPTVLMIGRSGGGWTSYFYSPLDPRIDMAVSVGGGLPLSLRANYEWRDMGDYEQLTADIGVVTHEDLMKSAGSQGALYIYNQHDTCCHTVDPSDPNYAAFITYLEGQSQALGKQLEVYVDTEHQAHSLGPRGYEKLDEFLNLATPLLGSTITIKGLSSVAL